MEEGPVVDGVDEADEVACEFGGVAVGGGWPAYEPVVGVQSAEVGEYSAGEAAYVVLEGEEDLGGCGHCGEVDGCWCLPAGEHGRGVHPHEAEVFDLSGAAGDRAVGAGLFVGQGSGLVGHELEPAAGSGAGQGLEVAVLVEEVFELGHDVGAEALDEFGGRGDRGLVACVPGAGGLGHSVGPVAAATSAVMSRF